MRKFGLPLIAAAFSCVFAMNAAAQDCQMTASKAATDTQAKLDEMIGNGLVQFAGYVAMISYAREKTNCADKSIYEDLYVKAVDNMPNTKMRIWKNWSMSRGEFKYPQSARNDGFGSKCTAEFDLPHAGQAENVRVYCKNPDFNSPVRKLMKTVYFAPPTLNEGFTKGEGLKLEMEFSTEITDWVF